MTEFFKSHLYRYPLMRTSDFIKLACQQEYGRDALLGGVDENALKLEIRETADSISEPVSLPVSEKFARINLKPYTLEGYGISTLAEMCKKVPESGSAEGLKCRLNELTENIECGAIDLPLYQAKKEIAAFISSGAKSVGHSASYRLNYFPHYRIVNKTDAFLLPFIARIDKLLYHKLNVTVAIEGHSGTGKSYYAEALRRYYGNCTVIHCDDFFLPKELRTSQRLSQAGGNVHYERLAETVAEANKEGEFLYGKYDCLNDTTSFSKMQSNRLTVVEGVYSMHPALKDFYDAAIVLTASMPARRERIINRSGVEKYGEYIDKWIPLEDAYFDKNDFKDAVVLSTDEEN